MLAMTEKELDQRPEVLERFMRATCRGYQGAMADPAPRPRAHRRVPEVDADLVRQRYLATRYSEDPAEWGWQDAAVWTRFAGAPPGGRHGRREVDVDAAFTNDLL